jgi:hypothetical protein
MTPLFLLSCSSVKTASSGSLPIAELYDGPIWRQAKRNLPHAKIAALSARHGILEPGSEIEPYDQLMDEDRLLQIANDPAQIAKLVELAREHGKIIIVGGELYKLFALSIVARFPALLESIHFACGSYLQQRHALKCFFDGGTK